MASHAQQAAFSQRAFQEIVWPVIRPLVGGGELKMVEGSASHLALDMVGGIDAYQVFSNGVRTIAQRVQRVDDVYSAPRTLTVRSSLVGGGETELQKRVAALKGGMDLPHITVQAYVIERAREFVWAAIVHTAPYYQWIASHADSLRSRRNSQDGNGFVVVPVDGLVGVPLATTNGLIHDRAPSEFFADAPRGRFI